MAVTSELNALHRTLQELRANLSSVRSRYGDVPAVRRLVGDLDRIDLDAAELEGLVPVAAQPADRSTQREASALTVIDDRPIDPSLWADADDEGLGGYHR